MTLDPIAQAYLDWCERERVPANTVRRRRSVLRAVPRPGTISRLEMETWWRSRDTFPDGRPRADSSRANELAVLRSFYRWCSIWEHRTDDPTARLLAPTVPSSVPRPAARTELDRIREHVADKPELRRAVILGAYCGLRVSEAARATWGDVDLEFCVLTVVGKGRKRRRVKVQRSMLDELLPADDRCPVAAVNIVTGTAVPLEPDALRQRANRAFRAAGVDITFHQLRHRYGTLAFQATRDLVAVRDAMGHASISTTAGYAAAATEVQDTIAAAVLG
ncbi:hypothetical protein GCM10022215_23880 [Nocardioides fonticola]|uniref:Site-specific integrase n=1 Tax=Nocardioides fonticola TaxID=450363 RepID=A0ABP7XJN1_9ACTN